MNAFQLIKKIKVKIKKIKSDYLSRHERAFRKEIENLIHSELDVFKNMPGKRDSFIDTFCDIKKNGIDLRQAKILEIGCDANLISANYFIKQGAKSVLCCNLKVDHIDLSEGNGKDIKVMRCDASKHVFDEKFDFVYGRAILEHINDLPGFIENLKCLVKKNGWFHFDGGPMWDSALGYHLWYTTASGKRYTMADKELVVRRWEHLEYNQKELTERLIDRGVPQNDATDIAAYIYCSVDQNRMFGDDIERLFKDDTDLETVVERSGYSAPPPNLADRYGKKMGYNKMVVSGSLRI
jgi:hypothetical protein